MGLSSDLISQFVKATNDNTEPKKETTVYGTVVLYNGTKYVKIDGSDLLTPISTTADTQDGERVTVMIKNHSATVTGNISSPAARSADVKGMGSDYQNLSNKIDQFEILIADKVDTEALNSVTGRIDYLVSDNTIIKQTLTANQADISELQTDNVTISEKLTAAEADIASLKTDKLDTSVADITYATISSLDTTNADVHNLEATFADFESTTTTKLAANEASIKDLQTTKLSASDIEGKYANIDFSNIGKAAMEYFYSNSGLIQNVTVGESTITGQLVGVTISGDLIEGNTVVADKLVIKGSNGLYYKLNTDGITTESEQTDYNSLNGQVIKAKSITATKISVDDLVAFDATIGGFNITENSIYSGVKSSIDNTTTGLYMDKDGQMALGDANSFVKYYKDQNGDYHLEISAQSVLMSTSESSEEPQVKTIEDAISELSETADSITAYVDEVQNVAYSTETRTTDLESMMQLLSDSIAMLVTDGNGESLMTQTETGWTFSTSNIQSIVDSTSENLDNLINEVGDVNSTITILQQAVDDLGVLSEYVKIETYEGEPCIELGESDSDFKLLITNTRIMFKEGSDVPAYFNNQSMYIKKAVIEEELQQGQFVWKARGNGNLGLIWKGVTN